jgi:hypothetical protein
MDGLQACFLASSKDRQPATRGSVSDASLAASGRAPAIPQHGVALAEAFRAWLRVAMVAIFRFKAGMIPTVLAPFGGRCAAASRGRRPMRRHASIGPPLALALVAAAGGALGQGRDMTSVDLTQLSPSLEPDFTQWRTGRGAAAEWTVVKDPSAEGGRAIAQISKDKTGYRFPLAVYKPFSGKNLEASVRFKPVAGAVDRAGGIAVRLLTPDDYYVVRANALEDNVRFYRVVKGKREQLAGADVKVASNVWHRLSLKAEGDRFSIAYDGQPLFAAQDATFADAGKVALWTKADSVTHFDTLIIRALP